MRPARGHFTEAPAAHVEIWFDTDVQSGVPGNGYPYAGQVGGTPHTHPLYDPNAFFRYDLGVVELDTPLQMAEYGVLPQEDQLDSLSRRRGLQDVEFTAVGTCFGDSGGPNFVGRSNVIAGVTSYARNGNCAGTGGVYRVDRADDLDWLATFGMFPPRP